VIPFNGAPSTRNRTRAAVPSLRVGGVSRQGDIRPGVEVGVWVANLGSGETRA